MSLFLPGAASRSTSREEAARIAQQARKALPIDLPGQGLRLGESSTQVAVSEVPCSDPGCPTHTVVMLSDGEARLTYRIAKASADIGESDIKAATSEAVGAEAARRQPAWGPPGADDWRVAPCSCCDPPGCHPPGACTCCYPGEPAGWKIRVGCGCCHYKLEGDDLVHDQTGASIRLGEGGGDLLFPTDAEARQRLEAGEHG